MYLRSYLLSTLVFVLTAITSFPQGKFKAGPGFNFISNNLDNEYLESYFAQSLHLSYAIFRKERFSILIESASSLQSARDDYGRKTGFISSLPVNGWYEFRKIALHAGGGPAYLYQSRNYYQQKHQVSGSALHLLSGIAFKGQPIVADVIYPEYTIRPNYYKDFRGSEYDTGMLSFIVYLRGA